LTYRDFECKQAEAHGVDKANNKHQIAPGSTKGWEKNCTFRRKKERIVIERCICAIAKLEKTLTLDKVKFTRIL